MTEKIAHIAVQQLENKRIRFTKNDFLRMNLGDVIVLDVEHVFYRYGNFEVRGIFVESNAILCEKGEPIIIVVSDATEIEIIEP